jgi:hypothetical protein
MRCLVFALTVLAAGLPATAQVSGLTSGEGGAPILQLTTAARAAALGGALTAADGVLSILANPAGATTVRRFEVAVSGQTISEGINAGAVAVGLRRHSVGVALSARYIDLGGVDEVTCNGCGGLGTPTGLTLSASEQSFALVGAIALGPASVGAAANYYSAKLAEQSGSGASFSAGVRAEFWSRLTIGASAQYLGGSVDVGGFAAPLPRTTRVGAEIRPLGRDSSRLHIVLAVEGVAVRGEKTRIGGGAEFGMVDRASHTRAVGRLGFVSRSGDEKSQPVTVGAGLQVARFAIDYAYQYSYGLGNQNRIGVTFAW